MRNIHSLIHDYSFSVPKCIFNHVDYTVTLNNHYNDYYHIEQSLSLLNIKGIENEVL